MTKRAIVLTCVALLAGAACSNKPSVTPTTQPPPTTGSSSAGNAVAVTMVDFKFQPDQITASTSQAIVLTNSGSTVHNFSIEGTSVSVDVQPGQTQTLQPPGPSFTPGTYNVFCKFHKSLGMTGTLTATSG